MFRKLTQVPNGWEIRSLKSLLASPISDFGSFSMTNLLDFRDEGVPFLRTEAIYDHGIDTDQLTYISERVHKMLPKSVVYPGDILFTKIGAIGRVCIYDGFLGECNSNAASAKVRLNSGIADKCFVVHYLRSNLAKEQYLNDIISTPPRINLRQLNNLMILLPPLPEQHRIAEILDTADAAIRQTEAYLAKLKQIKAGLLHDLLTRGLDPQGRLRDPIAHPEQFKDSPLGRVPGEWEVRELVDVAVKIQDGTHFSPQSTTGPFRYVTSKNIRFGYLDLTECGWISEKEHKTIYARCDTKFGDVLLTKDGANTGNASLNTLKEPISLLSSVAMLRFDGISNHSRYVLQYLLSPTGQNRIKDLMSGNAITRLTLEKIKAFIVPFPSGDEQKHIASILEMHDTLIHTKEDRLAKLRQVKQGLMQDLLTGRVRV